MRRCPTSRWRYTRADSACPSHARISHALALLAVMARLALMYTLLASLSHGGVAAASTSLRGAGGWARSLQQLEADELSPSDPGSSAYRVESVPSVEREVEIEHTASAPGGRRERDCLWGDLRTVGRLESRVTAGLQHTVRAYAALPGRLHSPT
jgi:hypothetical protein